MPAQSVPRRSGGDVGGHEFDPRGFRTTGLRRVVPLGDLDRPCPTRRRGVIKKLLRIRVGRRSLLWLSGQMPDPNTPKDLKMFTHRITAAVTTTLGAAAIALTVGSAG